MKTVGELKEFIKNLDDNMPLISTSSNFELQSSVVSGVRVSVEKFSTEKQQFVDAFDHTVYYEEVYVSNKNGTECLRIG